MGEPEQLQRLAARTRELAEELDRARPDLLSVTELNRALRHILATQASILEALAGVSAAASGVPLGGASGTQSRPQIRVTPSAASPSSSGPGRRSEGSRGDGKGFERRDGAGRGQRIELDPDDLPDDPILDLEPVEEFDGLSACEPPRAKSPPARHDASGDPSRSEPVRELLAEPRPGVPEAGPRNGSPGVNGNGHAASADADADAVGGSPVDAEPAREALPPVGTMAATWLNETRTVPGYLARQFVSQFDNRDKDYDKGLDKLNRWISAGGAGTPFQWRGDQAYLNLHGSGATSARNYEDQLMTRMGFSRRLGRLDVPGLEGEIVIYERPS